MDIIEVNVGGNFSQNVIFTNTPIQIEGRAKKLFLNLWLATNRSENPP